MSQEDFANLLGLKQVTYHRYEKGRVPKLPVLTSICKKLGVEMKEMVSAPLEKIAPVLPLLPANTSSGGNVSGMTPISEFTQIPVVGDAAAGRGRDFEDVCNQLQEMITSDCVDPNAFAITVAGDSMLPEFKNGERVVISTKDDLTPGKPVALKDLKGNVYFKIFHPEQDGRITLKSTNPAYPDLTFKPEMIEWIYKAHGKYVHL